MNNSVNIVINNKAIQAALDDWERTAFWASFKA
jgi:hypothetical protein